MKKPCILYIFVLFTCILFVGCERGQDGKLDNRGEGTLRISLETSGEVEGILTRASELIPELENFGTEDNLKKFVLSFYQGDVLKEQWQYGTYTEPEFSVGQYYVTASLGDISHEGFESPAFLATETFEIEEESVTEVNLVARLVNARVTVEYTENFRNYFEDYSVEVNEVEFLKDEMRGAYFQPGIVTVSTQLKKQGASSMVKLKLKDLEVKACSEYRITLDVDAGASMLNVSFDGNLVDAEPISISVSDSDLTTAPPVLIAENFIDNIPLSLLEGELPEPSPVRVVLNASCGIGSLKLVTVSPHLEKTGWPTEIDLASAEDLSLLTDKGLKIKGLDANSEGMAIVDFTQLIANLEYFPENTEYKFSLTGVDKRSRETETVVLRVVPIGNSFAVDVSDQVVYGSQCISFQLDLDGSVDEVTYAWMKDGSWQPLSPLKVETLQDPCHYQITLDLQEMQTDRSQPIQLKISYGDRILEEYLSVGSPTIRTVFNPGDIWAKKASLQAGTVAEAGQVEMTGLSLYVKENNGWIKQGVLPNDGKFVLTNLIPNKEYQARLIRQIDSRFVEASEIVSFRTEAELQVPNGNMEDWTVEQSYQLRNGFFGKKETVTGLKPNSGLWATTNEKTMRNATYVCNGLPSVYTADREGFGKTAVLRSVGWTGGTTNTDKICYNRSAGKLFLGTYSFDGEDHLNYGIPFASRPKTVKFDFKYWAYKDDKFKVWAVVENREGGSVTRLAYGELSAGEPTEEYATTTIDLTYDERYTHLKGTHFYIVFSSSNCCRENNGTENDAMYNYVRYTNNRWIGSELNIDSVELIY